MRAAIAAAPVGDDQYGEDPTVNRLQELAGVPIRYVSVGTRRDQIIEV